MSYRFETNSEGNPEIVIDGWQNGIADSPFAGLQDVRCMNIDDVPGVMFTQPESTTTALAPGSQATSFAGFVKTFTASDSGGKILITFATYPTSTISTSIAVTFSNSGGALPTGLVAGTQYYLVFVSTTTFKVATSYANAEAGTTINYTDAGTGTHTATSVNMGKCTCATIDPRTGIVYALDQNGRVWIGASGWALLDGNTRTNATGNGIAVYNDWLFVFRNTSIDVYGNLSEALASRAWYNAWQTMNAPAGYTGRHDTIVGQDGTLYWTDYDSVTAYNTKGYIGSLRPVAGQLLFADTGDPSTSNSTTNYTYSNQALDLPVYEEPVALEELGSKLIIAVNGYLNGFTKGYSKIYSWDRISPSFDPPLFVPDNPLVEMINLNDIIYIFGGTRGRIYRTNLSTVEFVKKIPDQLFFSGEQGTTSNIEGNPLRASSSITFSNNIAVARKKIFFGVQLVGASALYSYDPAKDILKIENRAVVGTYGTAANAISLPCVIAPGAALAVLFSFSYVPGVGSSVFGWDSAIPAGQTDSANTFYSYVITDMIPVATKIGKRNFAEVEWKLDTPMGPTDAVRISYRTANNTNFTTIDSTSYSAGLVPQISAIYEANIENAELLQFKIETSSTNTTGSTGVRFKELRVR